MLSMPTASRSFGWEWFEACVCNKMIAYLIMYKLLVMKQMFNDSVKIVCLTEYDCLYSNGVCLLKNEVPLNLSLRFFVGKISVFLSCMLSRILPGIYPTFSGATPLGVENLSGSIRIQILS